MTKEFAKTDFQKSYLDAYQTVRAVLEIAEHKLETPHSLWSELNELIEVCDRMERELKIANPTNAFKKSLTNKGTRP